MSLLEKAPPTPFISKLLLFAERMIEPLLTGGKLVSQLELSWITWLGVGGLSRKLII